MDKTLTQFIAEEKEEKKIIERFEEVLISFHDAFELEQPPKKEEVIISLDKLKSACSELLKVKKSQKKRMPAQFQADISAFILLLIRTMRLIDETTQQHDYNAESIDRILKELTKLKEIIETLISKALKPQAKKAA